MSMFAVVDDFTWNCTQFIADPTVLELEHRSRQCGAHFGVGYTSKAQ